MRDEIGIKKYKKELEEVRKTGNKEKIAEKELEASNSIIKALNNNFPYQLTIERYGEKSSKIQQSKELFCVGFSIVGHSFLSELGIKHKGLDILNHSALEINIGGKRYYFDATGLEKIIEFQDGKKIGAYEEIEIEKNKFIKINPLHVEKILLSQIYNDIGVFYKGSGKYKEAIKMYNKAIELNPKFLSVYNNLGFIYKKIGEIEKTINIYDKIIKLNPNDLKTYEYKVFLLHELGKYNEDIKIYDKIIELKPEGGKAYMFKGLALHRLGKTYLFSLYYFSSELLKGNKKTINKPNIKDKQKIKELIENKNFDGLREYLLSLEK